MSIGGRRGSHPQGNPEVMAAIQGLDPSNPTDLATLQAIAQGGQASLGQWQNIAWSGDPKKEDERQEERELAASLLGGDYGRAQELSEGALATSRAGKASSLQGVGKVVGKAAQYAAPVLALTGVGLPLAAGIGAAGALAQGKGLKGAAMGAGGAVAGHLVNRSGVLDRASQLMRSGGGQGPATTAGGSGGGGGGGILGTVRDVGAQFGINSPRDLLELGIGAAGAVRGGQQMGRADSARATALAQAQQDYAGRSGLRQTAMRGLTGPEPERQDRDLVDRGNPFSTGARQQPARGQAAMAAARSLEDMDTPAPPAMTMVRRPVRRPMAAGVY